MCCDGTLFDRADLETDEIDSLPPKIVQSSFSENSKIFFRLPCKYFNSKCTIYEKKKAHICSAYRCQLLVNFSEYKITMDEAYEIILMARKSIDDLLNLYQQITNKKSPIYYRKLRHGIKKLKESNINETLSLNINVLIAKNNIFEALLVKHFKSEKKFMEYRYTNDKTEDL